METQFLVSSVVLAIVVVAVTMGSLPFLILMERKVAAYIQDRLGPNRVGPWGLLQSFADGLKIFLKEEVIPGKADGPLFVLAPALAMFGAMATLAIIPFGGVLRVPWLESPVAVQIAPGLDIGVLYVVMIATASVYGIILGGWASNSKYPFFGALRGASQMLSYEAPLGLALLSVVLLAGDLRPEAIVARQAAEGWFILYQPAVFLVFLICAFAEANRLPFDLPESEQELVGGFHTEYSSMKFAMFFLGEYSHLIGSSALLVTLFLGGWHLPYLTPAVEGGIGQTLLKAAIFSGKVVVMIFVFMWVRWTLPRFRFDQLLRYGWCGLLPASLVLLCVSGVLAYLGLARTVWMLVGNVAVLVGVYGWMYLKESRSAAATDAAQAG
ncbi:MAG: NADH-quinone oxidoreductase subunit NuoH [Phycisphaerae bacterium]|nr:NADH-quinone oxidoreductase subunit NuoH [Phycisphaerae bacterium]